MYIDIKAGQKHWREIYRLCISFIIPRPIALVSTLSADGRPNLAPFSFFNMVSSNPPVVVLGPGAHRDKRPKDTLVNIRETGEFVIATVTEAIAEPMVRCAAELPYGANEFEFSGLTGAPATQIKPALVKESPINIECRLRQIVSFSDEPGGGCAVFGDIVALHLAEWLLDTDGLVDPHKLRPVGRLGGKAYCTVRDFYELHIPEPG